MTTLNAKNNEFVPNINTRATRQADAVITLGVLSIEFKENRIRMKIGNAYRDANKQLIADIERVLGKYIGVDVATAIKPLTAEVLPLAVQLDTNI